MFEVRRVQIDDRSELWRQPLSTTIGVMDIDIKTVIEIGDDAAPTLIEMTAERGGAAALDGGQYF